MNQLLFVSISVQTYRLDPFIDFIDFIDFNEELDPSMLLAHRLESCLE
jgi:hypothetical protein